MELKKLRKKAEEMLSGVALENPDELSRSELQEIIHELHIHQIELEIQNEELRELQNCLEEAKDQYTELFDFAPVGYFILDTKGIIQNVNITACHKLRSNRNSVQNTPFLVYVSKENDSVERFFAFLKDVFKSNETQSCEILLKSKIATPMVVQLEGTAEGNKCRIIMTDVSKIKQAELEIQKSLEKEQRLIELKSRFITMASHEFRTPLTTILSTTHLLSKLSENDLDIEKLQKYIGQIRSSIFLLTGILEEFDTIEKLESGDVVVKKSTFDIGVMCNKILVLMSPKLKEGQRITYRQQEPLNIFTDYDLINKVLTELLSNALIFSEEHQEIILETTIKDKKLKIRVEDHGIGIQEEDKEHIFERFYRGKNAQLIGGSGIGLYIVKKYVELLNGRINIQSELNKGSKLVVGIPLS